MPSIAIVGAGPGGLFTAFHLQDLLGLRLGSANTTVPETAGPSEESLGSSYSNEIYVVDLKLGGLVRRLHGDPGFSRFLLTSFVFFTKGFGYDPPLPSRYQNAGVEIGINFPEILKAANVHRLGGVIGVFFGADTRHGRQNIADT